MIAILEARSRRPDYWSFHLSHALILTADSTGELLIGCLGGQYVWHWLDNLLFDGRSRVLISQRAARLDQRWHCTALSLRQLKIRLVE